MVRRSAYLWRVMILVALVQMVVTFVDFDFNQLVQQILANRQTYLTDGEATRGRRHSSAGTSGTIERGHAAAQRDDQRHSATTSGKIERGHAGLPRGEGSLCRPLPAARDQTRGLGEPTGSLTDKQVSAIRALKAASAGIKLLTDLSIPKPQAVPQHRVAIPDAAAALRRTHAARRVGGIGRGTAEGPGAHQK